MFRDSFYIITNQNITLCNNHDQTCFSDTLTSTGPLRRGSGSGFNIRRQIAEANSSDKRLFFHLIKRQRQKGNTFINDLHVGDEIFAGMALLTDFINILVHWHNLQIIPCMIKNLSACVD